MYLYNGNGKNAVWSISAQTGDPITVADVADVQKKILAGSHEVTIVVVIEPRAHMKTNTRLPTLARPPRAPAASAARDNAGLVELLHDLDDVSKRMHKKYKV